MEFGGRYMFAADREAVWAALNDASLLKAVIPGCQEIGWTSPASLDLKVRFDLGMLHPVFAGELGLSDVHPAQSYTLTGRGKGMLGLAQATARITLEDAPGGGTHLAFLADGKASGGVMKLGRTMIGNSAQRVIDGFFEAIGREMGTTVTALPRG